MTPTWDCIVTATFIGAGATAFLDLWTLVRQRWQGVPPPDYGLVGRWLAHMPRGMFRHASIAAATPVRGERIVGWVSHYLIGVAFASGLLAIWGLDWARQPTLGPALLVGVGTVAAPFLLMQPGMGLGIAARRTPRPGLARRRSLVMHAMFGLGLYIAAEFARVLGI